MGEACILPHNESDTHGRQPGTPSKLTDIKIWGHVLQDT